MLDLGIDSNLYTSPVDDTFKDRTFLLPGELASAAGVSTDTLRHYERKGVIPRPYRAANGYRHYPKSSLERIRLVRNSLAVGFTLDELASIFAEREKGGAPCHKVYGLAVEKVADLGDQIRSLSELQRKLKAVVADWDVKLAASKNGGKAGLLNSLSQYDIPAKERSSKLSPKKKRKNGER